MTSFWSSAWCRSSLRFNPPYRGVLIMTAEALFLVTPKLLRCFPNTSFFDKFFSPYYPAVRIRRIAYPLISCGFARFRTPPGSEPKLPVFEILMSLEVFTGH